MQSQPSIPPPPGFKKLAGLKCSVKNCKSKAMGNSLLHHYDREILNGKHNFDEVSVDHQSFFRYPCPEKGCSATFCKERYLKIHIGGHTYKPQICPREYCRVCTMFNTLLSLTEHIQTHHTLAPPISSPCPVPDCKTPNGLTSLPSPGFDLPIFSTSQHNLVLNFISCDSEGMDFCAYGI